MARELPTLELLRGFEAAARNLSFTRAAAELHLTQSALSRQTKALEAALGAPLFERRHRAIALTEAGQTLYRATAQALALLGEAVAAIREQREARPLTLSCSIGFASLWLVPRLPGLREAHPEIDLRISANNRIVDLDRERIELAIRYCPPHRAPPDALPMFGEDVFPVCSPALLGRADRPLATPADLRHHVLLVLDDEHTRRPTSSWALWLEVAQLRDLKPAGTLHFSHYDLLIQAAADAQGVALGVSPLVRRLIQQQRLVAPFEEKFASSRAYYLLAAKASAGRDDVKATAAWLLRQAAEPVEG